MSYQHLDPDTCNFRYAIFECLDNPGSSPLAAVWGAFQMILVFVSCGMLFKSEDSGTGVFAILELVIVSFFTFDYVGRLITAPNVGNFFWRCSSLVDLISILPFFISLLFFPDAEHAAGNQTFFVRFFRLVRLFKLTKFYHLLAPPAPTQSGQRSQVKTDAAERSRRKKEKRKAQHLKVKKTKAPTHVVVDSIEGYGFGSLSSSSLSSSSSQRSRSSSLPPSYQVELALDEGDLVCVNCEHEPLEQQGFVCNTPVKLRLPSRVRQELWLSVMVVVTSHGKSTSRLFEINLVETGLMDRRLDQIHEIEVAVEGAFVLVWAKLIHDRDASSSCRIF